MSKFDGDGWLQRPGNGQTHDMGSPSRGQPAPGRSTLTSRLPGGRDATSSTVKRMIKRARGTMRRVRDSLFPELVAAIGARNFDAAQDAACTIRIELMPVDVELDDAEARTAGEPALIGLVNAAKAERHALDSEVQPILARAPGPRATDPRTIDAHMGRAMMGAPLPPDIEASEQAERTRWLASLDQGAHEGGHRRNDVAGDVTEAEMDEKEAAPTAETGDGDDADPDLRHRERDAVSFDRPPEMDEIRATLTRASLTPRQLRRAKRLNPKNHQRLGFDPAVFGGGDLGSDDFALAVAQWQTEHGVAGDGVAGPRTCAAAGLPVGVRGRSPAQEGGAHASSASTTPEWSNARSPADRALPSAIDQGPADSLDEQRVTLDGS